MASTKSTSKPYVCEYCGVGYSKENTLLVHMCEPKRRWMQKDEKRVQVGFYSFQRFYKLSTGAKVDKTYEDFVSSSFYNAFVKFGSFVNNVKPLYPEQYIDYIVTSGIALNKWCDEKIYEDYAKSFILKENVETALERSIKTMIAWAEEKSSLWNHYFLYASTNRITRDIKDGKISPWLILNCKTGKQALGKFSDEQLNMISDVINPTHWSLKFKRHPNDVELAKNIADEGKL